MVEEADGGLRDVSVLHDETGFTLSFLRTCDDVGLAAAAVPDVWFVPNRLLKKFETPWLTDANGS